MTGPAADYLAKARQSLSEARAIANIELPEAAGRAAYLTAYHAAQAFIFARTDKVAKTHSGVRSEFARLAKDDPRIDRAFSTFLAQAMLRAFLIASRAKSRNSRRRRLSYRHRSIHAARQPLHEIPIQQQRNQHDRYR
jgi:uncharacterized protein (UPF0332 family)